MRAGNIRRQNRKWDNTGEAQQILGKPSGIIMGKLHVITLAGKESQNAHRFLPRGNYLGTGGCLCQNIEPAVH